jgi:hypothetical protein
MPIPEYKGRSADEIAAGKFVNDSAWQIHASLSWCDYAERKQAPTALHYAGLHLRTGVEQLWFEVLFAASGGSITSTAYEEALNSTTKLHKLIDMDGPHYVKFAEFIQILASVDSRSHPPTVVWDIARLKRIHGGCSELLLHFQGIPEKGYRSDAWNENRLRFLLESASWMWSEMTSRGNLAVYAPEGLKKPEVFSLWERYRDGTNTAEDVRIGLRIIQPIVGGRPFPPS